MIGWFFLRTIAPAIVAPQDNEIISKSYKISGRERRNLVIIAKTLQSITNGSTFDDKEDYMSVFSNYASFAISKCQYIFDKITEGPIEIAIEVKLDKAHYKSVRTATKKLQSIIYKNGEHLMKIVESKASLEGEIRELIEICTSKSISVPSSLAIHHQNNEDLKSSWEKIQRRRESFKHSLSVIDSINLEIFKLNSKQSRMSIGLSSPRRSIFNKSRKQSGMLKATKNPSKSFCLPSSEELATSSQLYYQLSEPARLSDVIVSNTASMDDLSTSPSKRHSIALSGSMDSLNKVFHFTSDTTTRNTDTDSVSIVSSSDFDDTSELTAKSSNKSTKSTSQSISPDCKIIVKVKYQKKIVNFPMNATMSFLDFSKAVIKKFALKTSTVTFVHLDSDFLVSNQSDWNVFLENEGVNRNEIVCYSLSIM